MGYVWTLIATICLGGASYLWLFPSESKIAQPEIVNTQVEIPSSQTIEAKPSVFKARPLDEVQTKLKESHTALQAKASARAEVEASVHGTPNAVMNAGATLGNIAELEAEHPERKDEFIKFYQDCYASDETITVTRVQCLKRYVKAENLSQESREEILIALPLAVQKLYRRSEGIK